MLRMPEEYLMQNSRGVSGLNSVDNRVQLDSRPGVIAYRLYQAQTVDLFSSAVPLLPPLSRK